MKYRWRYNTDEKVSFYRFHSSSFIYICSTEDALLKAVPIHVVAKLVMRVYTTVALTAYTISLRSYSLE